MNYLAKKLSKIVLSAALVLAFLALFGMSGVGRAADWSCTDIGSDGIADGIITVATSPVQSNCYTDGIDDNIEINLALEEASRISGSVHLLSGLYIIGNKTENAGDGDGTIYIKSNTKFYGDGPDTIIKLKDWANWGRVPAPFVGTHNRTDVTVATGLPLVGINEAFAHDIEIYNLTFDGNLANQCEGMDYGGGYYNTIRISHVTNLSIHDNYFKPTLNDHIRGADRAWGWPATSGSGMNNVLIFNNTMVKANHAAIGLLGAINCRVYGNDIVTGANAAIRLAFGAQNNIIENNTIHGGLETYGIELTASGNSIFENNTVRGNTIFAQGFEGIVLFTEYPLTSGTCNGTKIIGNIVYQNAFKAHAGIGVHDADNTIIEGNTIYNNRDNGIALGIYSGYAPHVAKPRVATVRNNIVTENTGYGIYNNDPDLTVIESYNLYYNNTLGASYGVTLGAGTITGQDPLFVNAFLRKYGPWPDNGPVENILDFHLKSEYGRWNSSSSTWVTDSVTSPAIGVGNPASDNLKSLWGGMIEMGAYGNTAEASRSGPYVVVPQPPADDKNKTDAHAADPYVYPVPYIKSKHANLTFSNLVIPSKINIYTIDGMLVYEKEVNESSHSFAPDSFSSGIYAYIIRDADSTNRGKIVIIK